MITREQIYAAAFAIIAPLGPPSGSPSIGNGTFKTFSRRLQLVENVDPSAFPCFFQQQINEPLTKDNFTNDKGVTFDTLNFCWYIYAYQGNQELPTTPVINPLVDSVIATLNATLQGDGGAPVFLNEGQSDEQRLIVLPTGITYWEGVLGDRAVCRIDLRAPGVNIG